MFYGKKILARLKIKKKLELFFGRLALISRKKDK